LVENENEVETAEEELDRRSDSCSAVERPFASSARYPMPTRVPSNRKSGGVEEDDFLFPLIHHASSPRLPSNLLVSTPRSLIGLPGLSPTPSNAHNHLLRFVTRERMSE
jgi:hypothetical protein